MKKSMKNFSDFLNEEINIKGNKGVPEEKLKDIERKGREKIAGTDIRQVGGRIMGLVGQSQQLTRGHERELEALAEEVIRDAFGGILDHVNFEINLVRNGVEVERFMKREESEKQEEREEEEQEEAKETPEEKKEEPKKKNWFGKKEKEPEKEEKFSKDQIKSAVDKRKLINNIIQGEAKNTKTILHSEIAKEGLKRIFGEDNWKQIFDLWDEITKLADKMDWLIPVEHKARMMEEHPEGMAGACSVRWPKKKKKDDEEEKPKEEKPKEDSTEEENPTVKARGVDFPMLLHETVKGIYEALSDPGMPKDAELATIVHQQTSSFSDEAEDFKYGPYLAADLRDFVNKNNKIDTYPNLREFVYGKLIDSERWTDDQCLENLKNVFLESPAGRKLIDDLIDESIKELKDWEESQKEAGGSSDIDEYIRKANGPNEFTEPPKAEKKDDGDTLEPTGESEEESEIDRIIKQSSQRKQISEDDYSQMGQVELQRKIDAALDDGDIEKVKLISKYMRKESQSIYLKEVERINESRQFHTRRKEK